MKGKYIYPSIDIEILRYGEKTLVRMETYLRKTYRRKYYLWKFYKKMEFKGEIDVYKICLDELDRLTQEIYRCQILGKVDPKLIMHVGGVNYPLFEKDPDQTPERERLIKIHLKN